MLSALQLLGVLEHPRVWGNLYSLHKLAWATVAVLSLKLLCFNLFSINNIWKSTSEFSDSFLRNISSRNTPSHGRVSWNADLVLAQLTEWLCYLCSLCTSSSLKTNKNNQQQKNKHSLELLFSLNFTVAIRISFGKNERKELGECVLIFDTF